MIQHGSVNNRQRFQEIADGELSLMPVSASIEWGGKGAGPSSLSPDVFYRDTVEDHPFLFFAADDEDDEDDIEEDDFDDVEDDFDDDFDDDDFDDDDDDDFDDDDDEYDYEEDVDYDDFDE
jgi:hypothetical protein